MIIADVLAQAFNRKTGQVAGNARIEEINTRKNVSFNQCHDLMDIKECYEAYWNQLNPNSEEVVFVQQITLK